MSNTDNPKLAVLIDADNASASLVKELLEEVAKFGTATVKRAYGDWTGQQLTGWKDQLNRYAIQPIQQFAYTRGKNSTDASLIIDAMDLLYADNVDGFCLVSSDSDFTRLATRLRESRKVVYGLGERKTPEAFRAACDRFVFFEVLKRGGDTAGAVSPKPIADVPDLEHALRQAFDAVSRDEGWTTVSSVGSYMAKNNPSFDTRLYGFRKLSDMLRRQPYIEVKDAEGGATGQSLTLRLRPAAPTAPPAATKRGTARRRRGGSESSEPSSSSSAPSVPASTAPTFEASSAASVEPPTLPPAALSPEPTDPAAPALPTPAPDEAAEPAVKRPRRRRTASRTAVAREPSEE